MAAAYCNKCGRIVGTLTGRLLKGYAILCPDCATASKRASGRPKDDMMLDFLKDIFSGGKR
ncbi:MAG TPA: hypothetical protein VJZ49_15495 [Syntrophales bacterium]|nr:hypothetical protein [Syntrophales bacterium]